MGRPKALVTDADGTAWVTRSAAVLAAGGCDPVLVVVGASADRAAALVPPGARWVEAVVWAEGMGASLRSGLAELVRSVPDDVVAAVVGLVDTPAVSAEVVSRLVTAARSAGPAGLARAAYAGEPGHPVVLGRDHWAAVAASAHGDAGARAYLRGREVTPVECGDVGDGRDVDSPQP